MELNNEEIALLVEALAVLNIRGYSPTKMCEVTELENKLRKQLTKHDWQLDNKPSIFDDNYKCTRCGLEDYESADSSYTKPEFGCKS